MGQAKRRGDFETRLKEGLEKERQRHIVREERARIARETLLNNAKAAAILGMAVMFNTGVRRDHLRDDF